MKDRRYYQKEQGTLQSSVFVDPEVYRREIDGIFRRSWLFVSPANWLREAGDFVTARMGEDNVIVWTGNDQVTRVFENLCLAGHQAITDVSRGRSAALRCRCHGWQYDNQGRVVGQRALALPSSIRVETYKGLVFANHDAAAGPLARAIGEFAWYLDLLLSEGSGQVEAAGGDALTWIIDANWKLAAQAFSGDMYRDWYSHRDDAAENQDPSSLALDEGFQVSADGGAMVVVTSPRSPREGMVSTRLEPPRDKFTPIIGTLFPTMSFDWRTPSLHVWNPLGPDRTHVQSYLMTDPRTSVSERTVARRAFQFQYGPAGLRSQRDQEHWRSLSRVRATGENIELNFQMGLGRERTANIPGKLGDLLSESNQRAFFDWWQTEMERPGLSRRRPLINIDGTTRP
jgi:3-phenylpropionate/trans-cinnamate dioxygenase alpha subunit